MITMETHGVPETRRALELLVESLRKRLQNIVRQHSVSTQSIARKHAAVAFGHMKKGILIFYDEDGLGSQIISTAYHARFVEGIYSNYVYGRRPGRWPPGGRKSNYRPILAWAIVKGIVSKGDPETRKNSVEYLIRRKIGLKGTPAQPHMKPAREYVAPRFEADVRKAVSQAARQVDVLKRRRA